MSDKRKTVADLSHSVLDSVFKLRCAEKTVARASLEVERAREDLDKAKDAVALAVDALAKRADQVEELQASHDDECAAHRNTLNMLDVARGVVDDMVSAIGPIRHDIEDAAKTDGAWEDLHNAFLRAQENRK